MKKTGLSGGMVMTIIIVATFTSYFGLMTTRLNSEGASQIFSFSSSSSNSSSSSTIGSAVTSSHSFSTIFRISSTRATRSFANWSGIVASSNSSSSTSRTTSSLILSHDFVPIPSNYKIAFVKPVFTATAYSSFYTFYVDYAKAKPGQLIRTNLDLLNAPLVNTWGWSSGLGQFIESAQARNYSIFVGRNAFVISDVNVDQGALFYPNGTRRYSAVVLGFTEYVTMNEYQSYEHFVDTGGRLILLDACNFLAQVAYHPESGKVSLVLGHGWAFNGTAAWKSVYDRWINQSKVWVGSRYALYESAGYRISGALPNYTDPIGKALADRFGLNGKLFGDYRPHEENILTNSNDSIIARWVVTGLGANQGIYVVAAYELKSTGGGTVIHSGVFGSDILGSDREFEFFLREAILPNARL